MNATKVAALIAIAEVQFYRTQLALRAAIKEIDTPTGDFSLEGATTAVFSDYDRALTPIVNQLRATRRAFLGRGCPHALGSPEICGVCTAEAEQLLAANGITSATGSDLRKNVPGGSDSLKRPTDA